MVLSLANVRITDPSLPALLSLPPLQESCRSYLSCEIPGVPFKRKCIHVLQGEAALIDLGKESPVIGSSSATTCCILVAVCTIARRAAVAHLDEKAFKLSSRSTHSDWPTQLFAGMKRPKLFLVGGWGAEEFEFVQALLSMLHAIPDIEFQLELLCVGPANVNADGHILCRQLVVDSSSGIAAPICIEDQVPAFEQRSVWCWTSRRAIDVIYDSSSSCSSSTAQLITVQAPVIATSMVEYAEFLLAMDDDGILQNSSTSPAEEDSGYVKDVRAICSWVVRQVAAKERGGGTSKLLFEWSAEEWRSYKLPDRLTL